MPLSVGTKRYFLLVILVLLERVVLIINFITSARYFFIILLAYIIRMPSDRRNIQFMVTIYITAHGRADVEEFKKIHLTDREIYIGQEAGNCALQQRSFDERLLQLVTDWESEGKWLERGGKLGHDIDPDYLIGERMFENEAMVKFDAKAAQVGPASRLDKIMDMEGKPDEPSRPGVVVIIQDRGNKRGRSGIVRHILQKIYSRDDEQGDDPAGYQHRFSAIYFNNKLIEATDKNREGRVSKEFEDYVLEKDERRLSDLLGEAKYAAAELIGLRENDKRILYTIADTTCNVYDTDAISVSPGADQDETAIMKSERKAKALAKLVLTKSERKDDISGVDPVLLSVTPSHGVGYLYTGTESRLRMRPGDRPMKEHGIDVESEKEETSVAPRRSVRHAHKKTARKKSRRRIVHTYRGSTSVGGKTRKRL